jgi:DNA polymerase-1
MLALLRGSLAGDNAPGGGPSGAIDGAELVFFQHDEVVVHCRVEVAPAVAAAVERAGDQARSLLFGASPVRFPLKVSIVDCYAEAK